MKTLQRLAFEKVYSTTIPPYLNKYNDNEQKAILNLLSKVFNKYFCREPGSTPPKRSQWWEMYEMNPQELVYDSFTGVHDSDDEDSDDSDVESRRDLNEEHIFYLDKIFNLSPGHQNSSSVWSGDMTENHCNPSTNKCTLYPFITTSEKVLDYELLEINYVVENGLQYTLATIRNWEEKLTVVLPYNNILTLDLIEKINKNDAESPYIFYWVPIKSRRLDNVRLRIWRG